METYCFPDEFVPESSPCQISARMRSDNAQSGIHHPAMTSYTEGTNAASIYRRLYMHT